MVKRPDHMAGKRAGRAHDPLKLDGGEDVRETPIAEILAQMGIVQIKAGSENDGADIQLDLLFLLEVVDGMSLAGVRADMAITANSTGETTFGFRHRFIGGVANVNF